MKAAWLYKQHRPRLLIFFAGWGMDEKPFRRLASSTWDVLVYHDFRNLCEIPFLPEVALYPERALVGWSLGCAAANRLAPEREWTFSRALAINGTLIPEDDQAGIPSRWMTATAQGLTQEGSWEKFVRRMCPDAESHHAFTAGAPARDLQSSIEELQSLRRIPPPAACVFDSALVSPLDRVIRPENQHRCWERYAVPVRTIPGPHYPFHLWASWEELLA